jgi:hypothetical protein
MTKASGAKSEMRAVDLNVLPVGRRQLMVGIAALALAGCRDVTKGGGPKLAGGGGTSSSPPPPSTAGAIGPGASWTGAAGSGYAGAVPQDPVRTTAKPALQWWTPSRQRMSGDMTIGVDADALGGVAYVDFYVEGSVQRVTQTRLDDTDVNGKARSRVGYWLTLSNSAFVAKSPAGTANIYAKATANDTTMQARVIGPLVVFPRGSGVAWSKTVKPSGGGDFTSLVAAFQALNAAQPESAEVIIGETGTYELGIPTGYYGGHTGYVTLRAVPGVTATLVRGSGFDPLNATTGGVKAWEWWPWNGAIEFRGAGIVLDMKNWNSLRSNDEQPHWFNGCTIVNSIGTRDTLYWNLAPHPGLQISSFQNGMRCYFTDGVSRYVDLGAPLMMTNWQAKDQLSGAHGDCHFIAGSYETGSDPRFFTTLINAISVAYHGTGAATIVADVSARIDCRVNGVSVGGGFPITLGNNPNAAYFHMSDVAAAISAIPGGAWSATTLDNSRATWTLTQSSYTLAVGATPINLVSIFDFHTEWFHNRVAGAENFLFRDNIVRRSFFTTNILNCETAINDGIARNNVWECTGQSFLNGSWGGYHVVMHNCYYDAPFPIYAGDKYGSIAQTLFAGLSLGQGVTAVPTYPVLQNNIMGAASTLGGVQTNVVVSDYTAFAALVVDKANGDFRPAATLTSSPKPTLDSYDGRTNSRAQSDCVGPWAQGYSAPSYPF